MDSTSEQRAYYDTLIWSTPLDDDLQKRDLASRSE
jgi:hypothetical protein